MFLAGLLDQVVQVLLVEGHIVTRVPTLDDVLDLEGDKLLDHKLEGLGKDRETILIRHE